MPRRPRFGFDRIRAFAQARVAATTLRDVAKEIGMSYSGLHSFLQGGQPYARTRELLIAWYGRSRHLSEAPPSIEEVDAAITVLSQYLQRGGLAKVSEREFHRVVKRLRQAAEVPPHSNIDDT